MIANIDHALIRSKVMDIAVPLATCRARFFVPTVPSCTAQTRLAERVWIGHNAPGLADALSGLRRMLPYIHRTTGLPLHVTDVWHLPDGQAVPGIWRSMGRRVPDEPNTNTWSDSCGPGLFPGPVGPLC